MKIAVIACNRRVARLIIKEALSRGIEVTGFAREENKSLAKNFVEKDVNALRKEGLEGFDAVIDAAEPPSPHGEHHVVLEHLDLPARLFRYVRGHRHPAVVEDQKITAHLVEPVSYRAVERRVVFGHAFPGQVEIPGHMRQSILSPLPPGNRTC